MTWSVQPRCPPSSHPLPRSGVGVWTWISTDTWLGSLVWVVSLRHPQHRLLVVYRPVGPHSVLFWTVTVSSTIGLWSRPWAEQVRNAEDIEGLDRDLTFSSSSFFSVRFLRFRAVSSRFRAISRAVNGFFRPEAGWSRRCIRDSERLGNVRTCDSLRETCVGSTTFARTA